MMTIYPKNALEQLDFEQILIAISAWAAGQPARDAIIDLRPSENLFKIEKSLRSIGYFNHQIIFENYLGLSTYNVPQDLQRNLTIEDYVLPKRDVVQIREIVENTIEINRFILRADEEEAEVNCPFDPMPVLKPLWHEINLVMEDDDIRPNASPELAKTTKQIQRKQAEISTEFERIAKLSRQQGLLSDIQESYRNGRRVLALPAENKRKMEGIIHGESESGKTVFIEPQAVTNVNNALFQLELERQKEEYKILQKLTSVISHYEIDLMRAISVLIEMDIANAIANYSRKRGFSIPKINLDTSLELKSAFHPHLQLHLAKEGKKVIENNVVLHGQNRILLVSGPNAGGKSVALKTIAFAQLMFQSGLPVPAEADSKFRVFAKLALDMGDNQSMEDDLSTYSSHLEHMRNMLELADENTLLFIDEFGTGTDPRVGGALAESILHQFVKQRAVGVITTHYSNLKSYAHKTRGIVNGSMSFDMEKLSPTYQLQIGKPGSSFAFEIAQRMGLESEVIQLAKKKAGNQVYEMEKLLSQLIHEKEKLANKKTEIEKQEADLKLLTQTYSDLKKQLDIQRKKIKAEKKQELARLKSENIVQLNSMLDELKTADKTEKQVLAKVEEQKQKQLMDIAEAKTLNQEAYALEGSLLSKEDLQIGDMVRIRETDSIGRITVMNKKNARIAVGPLSIDVAYGSLIRAAEQLTIKKERSIQYVLPQASIPSRLDIRGMSFKEAQPVLNQYFDDALIRHMHQVEILHGRGNGVLRKLVRTVAREYKEIQEVVHPEEDAGGEAMSIVRF